MFHMEQFYNYMYINILLKILKILVFVNALLTTCERLCWFV